MCKVERGGWGLWESRKEGGGYGNRKEVGDRKKEDGEVGGRVGVGGG